MLELPSVRLISSAHSVGVGSEMTSSASVLKPPEAKGWALDAHSPAFEPDRPPALARKEPSELRLGKRDEVRLCELLLDAVRESLRPA